MLLKLKITGRAPLLMQSGRLANPLDDLSRDPEALYADPAFRDVRMVVIGKSRVPMCRPIFNRWGIEATLSFNEDLIDERDVRSIVSFAGRQSLGTFRRRFGKFDAEVVA